jgi:dTDP-4-dehydrorhamnose 3,5-epimerase
MRAEPTPLEGLWLIHPQVFGDHRGRFMETFNERAFAQATGVTPHFVQDNESLSMAGVLRGLHFQAAPHAQAKLVRVSRGAVLDVVVDIRPASPTFGKHYAVALDDRDFRMLYIPEGFAHGFRTLEDHTIFNYKCTAYYHPASERTIAWNDPALGIPWGISDPIVSEKDKKGTPFTAMAWT